ncbi:hypothetical protein CALVIDRAFT_539208 [Calocera viscosa TUFC12733]|uniref:Uncharacterized protein n=1 Tax=Calocera viscosa (strain TUFC12733) TaxID=1330018 RepID=A0A167K1N5_CALVF|nr:hypothetical protein CALVIDRAFT_539208 [Calocera viscosa TUFC12733]
MDDDALYLRVFNAVRGTNAYEFCFQKADARSAFRSELIIRSNKPTWICGSATRGSDHQTGGVLVFLKIAVLGGAWPDVFLQCNNDFAAMVQTEPWKYTTSRTAAERLLDILYDQGMVGARGDILAAEALAQAMARHRPPPYPLAPADIVQSVNFKVVA